MIGNLRASCFSREILQPQLAQSKHVEFTIFPLQEQELYEAFVTFKIDQKMKTKYFINNLVSHNLKCDKNDRNLLHMLKIKSM